MEAWIISSFDATRMTTESSHLASSRRVSPYDAVVIGGGLAGMTAAKELAEAGLRVLLLEKGARLGGKAGSVATCDGRVYDHAFRQIEPGRWPAIASGDRAYVDHGFHAFPGWYQHTRALLEQIGCSGNLIDFERFHFLAKGSRTTHTVYEPSSLVNVLHDVLGGPLGWAETLLSYYFVLELAAEPMSDRGFLDRVSATGLLRSRFYATERMASFQHQTVLQAAAVPYHEVSAQTLQRMFGAWLQRPSPVYSILNGSLQERFIEPFEAYLLAAPRRVTIRRDAEVEQILFEGGRASALVLAGTGERVDTGPACAYVVAVPREVTAKLKWVWRADKDPTAASGSRLVASKAFFDLATLESAPMSAVHLRYRRRLVGLPREHVNLLGSSFGITLIDLAPHWELPGSLVSIVASRTGPLGLVAEHEFGALIADEVRQYFPQAVLREGDVAHVQTNFEQPLFLNTVGSWDHRPAADTMTTREKGVEGLNVYLAGDYCRTDADLATMESAVMSGILAADAILARRGRRATAERRLERIDAWKLHALRAAALPVIVPIGLWKWAERRLRDLITGTGTEP